MNEFLSLYKKDTALSYEDRIRLVEASGKRLAFDPVFSLPQLEPSALAALLKTYGWFWVSIDADRGPQRRAHAVVVNDVSAGAGSSSAQVKYYDVADGKIQVENFTDFVQRVRHGALLPHHVEKAVIRLASSPQQGASPDAWMQDQVTLHKVFLEAVDWAFNEYKNKQKHPNLLQVGYEWDKKAGQKKPRLVLTYSGSIDTAIPVQHDFFSATLNRQVSVTVLQLVHPGPGVPGCEYKPSPTTITRLWNPSKPVYGARRVRVFIGGSHVGTLGGWFRDLSAQGAPVVLSNAHLFRMSGTRVDLVNGDPETGAMGLASPGFVTLRMASSDVNMVRDFAVARPDNDTVIPPDMETKGAEIVWGHKRYKTGEIKDPVVGEKVIKIGSQTGLTQGIIVSCHWQCINQQKAVTPSSDPSNFIPGFIAKNPQGIAASGDSGSLFLSAKKSPAGKYDIIGLLYMADENEPAASPSTQCMDTTAKCFNIRYVCDQLNLGVF